MVMIQHAKAEKAKHVDRHLPMWQLKINLSSR
jgi:hypothetical protein